MVGRHLVVSRISVSSAVFAFKAHTHTHTRGERGRCEGDILSAVSVVVLSEEQQTVFRCCRLKMHYILNY